MTAWIEIKDLDDLDISDDKADLHIYVSENYFGADCISVPIELIKKIMEEKGITCIPSVT